MGLAPVWRPSSVRPQWIQRTHAILPVGDYEDEYRAQGCALLDDGSFWANINGKQSVFQNQEVTPQWIGTMSPEGCLQYSGDLFTYDPALNSPSGSVGWVSNGYLPHLQVRQFFDDYAFLTDGKYIYYNVLGVEDTAGPGAGGGSTNDGMRWYRLDPSTAMIEWIAGAVSTEQYDHLDSHDGRSATFMSSLANYCDREYIYWSQFFGNPDTGSNGKRVRRMKLSPPYPIDTLPGLVSATPGWYTDVYSKKTINPATGLARMYDSDFANSITGMAVRGDNLYFFDTNWSGSALRRMPKTGGPVTTLIWAGERDGLSDYDDTLRLDDQAFFGVTFRGTPLLEGFWQWGPVRFLGNKLFCKNYAGTGFQQVYNEFAGYLVYFDIDEVEAQYARVGPVRINRANPQWRTVHGGSHYFDQRSTYTPLGWQQGGGHVWGWVDGGERPLNQYVLPIFDVNEKAAGWENRVAFVHSEKAEGIAPASAIVGSLTMNAIVAAWVEPHITGSQYKLTLQFTGDLLKGYAPVRDMGPASAPKEITLG